jgi:tetratricopeptide (TPR) repeat protein
MHTEILKSKRGISRLFSVVLAIAVVPLALYVTTGRALADVSEDFEQAQVYDDNGRYSEAAQVYQTITAQHAGTEHALKAQKKLTRMYVFSGQLQEAQTAYQDLLNSFSGHSGITKAVCEVADSYLYLNRQPHKALELYQYVLNTWPKSNDAMWAQAGTVKAHVQSQDEDSAQAAYTSLLANYSTHDNIPEAVYEIGDSYQQINGQKALELYEYAMSTWPDYNKWVDENDAILRRKNLVLLKLGVGDEAGAQAAYESMITFSSDNNATAKAVTELANAYLDSRKYQRARQLLEHAKKLWFISESSEIWAEVGLTQIGIALGKDPNLQSPSGFLDRFSGDPVLPQAVFTLAEEYFRQASFKNNEKDSTKATEYFEEAIGLFKKTLEYLPASGAPLVEAESRYLIAETYHQLGRHDKAKDYYRQVVDTWPIFEEAPIALLRICNSYRSLQRAGTVTKAEADVQIKDSYEQILQDYPDSSATKIARRWLNLYGN